MTLSEVEETIVAIASSTSPALRGVVRLSGDHVRQVLDRLGLSVDDPTSSQSGRRSRRLEVQVDVGPPIGVIPASLLWWPTSKSYTGQPSAELHTIGSLPVLRALVDAAIGCGARAAKPGEFTMRAFLSGRLDLTQAEAVLGVIEAEGRGALDHALRQLAGNLSRPLEQLRSDILDLLADVEAGLDFVDEDIEFISDEALVARLKAIDGQLEATWLVMRDRGGGAARPLVALRGEPNAGKSCLLNRLAGSQAAIVADLPGTTRDVVTAEATVAGRAITLIDTAGIESSEMEVGQRSQDQALRASQEAAVRLWCVDRSRADFVEAAQMLRDVASREQRPRVIDLWVATKIDRCTTRGPGADNDELPWIACSAVSGEGIGQLQSAIDQALSRLDTEETGSVLGTAARCRDALGRARIAIKQAAALTESGQGHEFVATELRTVAQCLGEITGAVYTDDILDRVFSRFCIGK